MASNRKIYFDLMRIFAAFSVVLLHTAAVVFVNPQNMFSFDVANVYNSAVRFCVPIFIMLSGVFFLDPKNKYPLKKLFSKNILRITVALIVWKFAYAVLGNFDFPLNFKTILEVFLFGKNHLWYLYMLIGLYLMVPFLRKITKDKKLTEYFLIISFIFAILIPFIKTAGGADISRYITDFMSDFHFYFVLGFPAYFVLGYYLSKYGLPRSAKTGVFALAILSLLFTIFATRYIYLSTGSPSQKYYEYLLPNTFFISMAIFIFFKDVVSKIRFSEKSEKFILVLSRCSFGVYLMHEGIRVVLGTYFGLSANLFNPLFSIPLIALIVFILSFIITFIISKIPILNKYII